MLVNVFMYVPSILIRERFDGAVLALPLGVLIGTIFLFLFVFSINKFPKLGLPEIIEHTPKVFRNIFLFFFALIWFFAGSITLLAFNNVIIRFINPDITGFNMISAFLVLIIMLLSLLRSDKILYTLEIIFILNLPLILIIMLQAYTNNYLTIDSVLEVGTHLFEVPSLSAIAAASFVFSGYANLVIFNRVFKEKINWKLLWIIPIVGFINLITSVLIPIGFWGADGVGDLTYPWIATSDALRIEFGPIERLTTIFILLYVSVATISTVVHWHVALEILKSIFHVKKFKQKKKTIFTWVILVIFGVGVILLEMNIKENTIFRFGEAWLNIRLFSEAFLIILMVLLSRRKKNGT